MLVDWRNTLPGPVIGPSIWGLGTCAAATPVSRSRVARMVAGDIVI
jgi:hypothetical protein